MVYVIWLIGIVSDFDMIGSVILMIDVLRLVIIVKILMIIIVN